MPVGPLVPGPLVPTPPLLPTPPPLPGAPATPDGNEPPPDNPNAPTGKVAQIAIRGNVNVTTAAIRSVITNLKVGSLYSQAAAEKDRASIKDMGYFNGEVALAAVADPAGGVDVAYTVKENPIVKGIKFTANTPTGEPTIPSATLKGLMQTKEGHVLNTKTLELDLSNLFSRQNGYVRKQGYIFDVSSDINIDPLNGVLNIPLVEAHIESIQIKGNKKTKNVVITRELHTGPGDVLDEKKLQKDLTRVYNLGLFDQVGPFDEVPTDVGRVIISIPVTEKRSGQVSVGVGYSSRAQLVGQATLAENNFRGLGERVSVMWEVGGIASQSSLDLSFFEPYLDKRHTSLDADVYDKVVYRFASDTLGGGLTTGNSNTYLERRRGGTLGLNRPFSDFLTGGLTFRSENVTASDVAVPIQDEFIRQKGSVSALGARAFYSNRDQDLAPASGGLRSLSYEIGVANTQPVSRVLSPLSPGSHTFNKLGLDLRQYMSLNGPRKIGNYQQAKKVLAVRLLLGFASKDVPFFEQSFLGGADSLRGYQTDRYWGSNLALFQSELRLPVGGGNNFQAVLLFDGGDAWNSIYQGQGLQQHSNFKFSGDYGLGIRLVTPIGPVRLDYAIPTGGGAGRTQFSIGPAF